MITQDIVINKILNTINHNIGSINKGLKQQAKIIFLNGTTDEPELRDEYYTLTNQGKKILKVAEIMDYTD